MTDLTSETLADDVRRWFSSAREGSRSAQMRDSILAALAASEAAREEAERLAETHREVAESMSAKWQEERERSESLERIANNLAEQRVDREDAAEARAVKAEQERDEAQRRYEKAGAVATDEFGAAVAAERELADLRARIEALADKWEPGVWAVGNGFAANTLRALLPPTDLTKEGDSGCGAGLHASQCQGCDPADCYYNRPANVEEPPC